MRGLILFQKSDVEFEPYARSNIECAGCGEGVADYYAAFELKGLCVE